MCKCYEEKKRKRDNERRIGAGLWKEITRVRDLNDILLVSAQVTGAWGGGVRVGWR